MRRTFISYLIFILSVISSSAMDFGLRFNSHSHPLEKRTTLSLGDRPFMFDNELQVGFHFNFYTKPLFGTLISVLTNDGTRVSVVASHQGQDAYMLGLVINDHMKLMKGLIDLDPDREDKIDITLNKNNNSATFKFNNDEISMPVDLTNTKSGTIKFGADTKQKVTDVAPIELRNVRVFIDNQNTNYWDLKYHDSDTSRIDELNGLEAKVINPHWLIDDHTDWTLIYSQTVKDILQTAFDPLTERFIIAGDKKIKVWSPLENDSSEYEVKGGYRPMAYSNHLLFDTISGKLINYNLLHRCIATFDFDKGIWTNNSDISPDEEANYANHAFALNGSTAYAFGGYGFYKFHNDLFKIDLNTGIIEECKLHPELMSKTSAAACAVGNKLYIFGGRGNNSGRQELPSKYNYSMYVYDTDTWQGEMLWQLDSVAQDFIPSQTMYYDQLDDCFYAASTRDGGEMIKISRTQPEINIISTEIQSKMEYHDFVFDLFRSKDEKRYYLLIDKRIDKHTHNYSIYTICAPFIDDPEIIRSKSLNTSSHTSSALNHSWIIVIAIILVIAAGAVFTRNTIRRRAKRESAVNQPEEARAAQASANDAVGNNLSDMTDEDIIIDNSDTGHIDDDITFFEKRDNLTASSRFDRSKSAISLLGAFNIRDKNGDDITPKFTDRLKSLLILLLLTNCKNANGIKYQTIDEQIWGDKDEKSAQNNRNVYMRKLRLLLEEVGNVTITYDKGYFRIECNDVIFDYGEAIKRISEIEANGNASPELVDETLDLLLMGPLLPVTSYDWLDQYKADYSDTALEILIKLLRYELTRDDGVSYKIAQIIMRHDPLNEDAMKAKCVLLCRKKMMGQAKNVYEKFCKEYKLSLGEEYPMTFSEVCRSQI